MNMGTSSDEFSAEFSENDGEEEARDLADVLAMQIHSANASVNIEKCVIAFLRSLVNCSARRHPILSTADQNVKLSAPAPFSLPLSRARASVFAFAVRCLSQVYHLRVSNTFATKRDLFYDQKSFYGTQRNLDQAVSRVCRLLNATRSSLNVLSSGRGIMMGALCVRCRGEVVDCSLAPVVIGRYGENEEILCTARMVLVVEKDAIFQKLIYEGFLNVFAPALLVTGKGYPDIATRKFLFSLSSRFSIPIFGLMDSDPHGIEIAMTYKYGGVKASVEVGNIAISSFEWIGLSRSEISRYPIPREQFLPLDRREFAKIGKLCDRALALGDFTLLRELTCLRESRTKLELEAVSGIAPGYLCNSLLREKLAHFVK